MSDSRFGKYDPLYNPRVHGTYDPSRYYGKPDKPLLDVTVKELPTWLSRRNTSIYGMSRAVGRGVWRWKLKHICTRNGNWKAFGLITIGVTIICANEHFHHVFNKRKYH